MRTVATQIKAPANETFSDVLTPDALDFLARLHREVEPVRTTLLEKRVEVAERLRAGGTFDFLTETTDVRRNNWRVATRSFPRRFVRPIMNAFWPKNWTSSMSLPPILPMQKWLSQHSRAARMSPYKNRWR